jgi:diguanylate cyclase (GGDEF)-like protein
VSNSFFVRTTTLGVVQEAYWSDPISLAIPYKTTLAELFDEDNRRTFEKTFTSALLEKHKVFCSHVVIVEERLELCFFILSLDQDVWVLAVDYLMELPPDLQERQKHLLFKMIEQVAAMHSRFSLHNSQVVYSHFEQIQKLNNQLVNTQRELQRANKKLEALNLDLNNRLVKDPLTGLVSRYQYRSEMQSVINTAPQTLGLFAFIDIDAFKHINDTYGHAVGDEYLIAFSKRLASLPFEKSTIAMRIAGDEFGLYMHNIESIDERLFESLYQIFEQHITSTPLSTSAGDLPISCSVGFAVYNRDTTNLFELIEYADWAMYQAKRGGKSGYRAFDKLLYDLRYSEQ